MDKQYCIPFSAIDLLERMLDLDPDTRISAEDALAHSYLKAYADPSDEPTSEPYDQSFEDKELDIPTWKREYGVWEAMALLNIVEIKTQMPP